MGRSATAGAASTHAASVRSATTNGTRLRVIGDLLGSRGLHRTTSLQAHQEPGGRRLWRGGVVPVWSRGRTRARQPAWLRQRVLSDETVPTIRQPSQPDELVGGATLWPCTAMHR